MMSMMIATPPNPNGLAKASTTSRTAGWVAFSVSVVATDRNRTGDVLAGGIAR
jgi:hypothetical protein